MHSSHPLSRCLLVEGNILDARHPSFFASQYFPTAHPQTHDFYLLHTYIFDWNGVGDCDSTQNLHHIFDTRMLSSFG